MGDPPNATLDSPMRTFITSTLVAAAAVMTLGVAVAEAQPRSYNPDGRYDRRDNDDRRGDDHRGRGRGHGDNDSRHGGRHESRDDDHWDNRWGQRPARHRGWGNRPGWYRHVRACQMRYRSYNPRTDMFVVRRGVMARCRL